MKLGRRLCVGGPNVTPRIIWSNPPQRRTVLYSQILFRASSPFTSSFFFLSSLRCLLPRSTGRLFGGFLTPAVRTARLDFNSEPCLAIDEWWRCSSSILPVSLFSRRPGGRLIRVGAIYAPYNLIYQSESMYFEFFVALWLMLIDAEFKPRKKA